MGGVARARALICGLVELHCYQDYFQRGSFDANLEWSTKGSGLWKKQKSRMTTWTQTTVRHWKPSTSKVLIPSWSKKSRRKKKKRRMRQRLPSARWRGRKRVS